MTGGGRGVSAPLCLPFARVSLRASQRLPAGLQPPGVLHRRQRDAPSGSAGPVRFGGSEERGGGAGAPWLGLSPQAGLASGLPNSLPPCCHHVLVSFKGLEMPCPGH